MWTVSLLLLFESSDSSAGPGDSHLDDRVSDVVVRAAAVARMASDDVVDR